jgi:CHASE2 domain-containing sensor protein
MLGTVLGGRYKLISELGTGGFGQTFLAEDTQQPDSLPCVVKQFKPASQDIKFLEIARRLFDTEVDTLKKLGQHNQIPQLLDFFEENREFYLVQEFIDGQPLSEELVHHRLTEAETIALLQDVLGILEFVHCNRVIHRDVKPGNLIRRRSDGKIVLIDFGAVKEIRTQLLSGSGQTSFTVGIGTQGYTPSEQLAGKPRYCSDLYALGMTAIHALTGLQPSQLPEDPDTGDLLWQSCTNVSPGLAFIINRMVRLHFSQRYQSAIEVLQALQQLGELPADVTDIPPSWLLADQPSDLHTQFEPAADWRKSLRLGGRAVAIAAVAVTGLLLGVRQMGWIEPLELNVFDRLTRLNANAALDPRLLIVTIAESDLQALQRPTPSDQAVAQVLQNLEQDQPRVIGLDLHRDLPQAPGQTELLRQLRSPNVITITELGNSPETYIPPPPDVPDDRVGFNDIAIDPDGVVRRNLLFATTDTGTFHSFSLRVALKYLAARNIVPRNSSINPDWMQIGNTTFVPLEATSGGYQRADAAGYQILMRYRSPTVARQVSFTDALNDRIDPSWVKDKIVLIGTTAPSAKDLFYTPFSAAEQTAHQMPGVMVHAHLVRQILDIALGEHPTFWFWSDPWEGVWILGWAIVGGSIAWVLRHPLLLGAVSIIALVILAGVSLLIFSQQGWVPIAAPAIALTLTGGAVAAYRTYQVQQQQRVVTQLWQQYLPFRKLDGKP